MEFSKTTGQILASYFQQLPRAQKCPNFSQFGHDKKKIDFKIFAKLSGGGGGG